MVVMWKNDIQLKYVYLIKVLCCGHLNSSLCSLLSKDNREEIDVNIRPVQWRARARVCVCVRACVPVCMHVYVRQTDGQIVRQYWFSVLGSFRVKWTNGMSAQNFDFAVTFSIHSQTYTEKICKVSSRSGKWYDFYRHPKRGTPSAVLRSPVKYPFLID